MHGAGGSPRGRRWGLGPAKIKKRLNGSHPTPHKRKGGFVR